MENVREINRLVYEYFKKVFNKKNVFFFMFLFCVLVSIYTIVFRLTDFINTNNDLAIQKLNRWAINIFVVNLYFIFILNYIYIFLRNNNFDQVEPRKNAISNFIVLLLLFLIMYIGFYLAFFYSLNDVKFDLNNVIRTEWQNLFFLFFIMAILNLAFLFILNLVPKKFRTKRVEYVSMMFIVIISLITFLNLEIVILANSAIDTENVFKDVIVIEGFTLMFLFALNLIKYA